MSDESLLIGRLASSPLCNGLSPDVIGELHASAEILCLGPGGILFREGDPGDRMFLVAEGGVEIERGGFVIVARGPGDCIGEMALLDGMPRSATVRAVTAVRLLSWPSPVILDALDRWPGLLLNLTRIISERMRTELHRRVEDLKQKRVFAAWLRTAVPRAEAPVVVVSDAPGLKDRLQGMFVDRKLTLLDGVPALEDFFKRREGFADERLPSAILVDASHPDLTAVLSRLASAAVTSAIPCLIVEHGETSGVTAGGEPAVSVSEGCGQTRFYWKKRGETTGR